MSQKAFEFEALICESQSIACEVAGMKAQNKHRELTGSSLAYLESDFVCAALKYEKLAQKFRALGVE